MSATERDPARPPRIGPSSGRRSTPFHVAHEAHLVPFAGWEMPLYYDGILAEHQAVRTVGGTLRRLAHGHPHRPGRERDRAPVATHHRRRRAPDPRPGPLHLPPRTSTGQIIDDLLITRVDRGATTSRPTSSSRTPARPLGSSTCFDSTDARTPRSPATTARVAILAVQGPEGSRDPRDDVRLAARDPPLLPCTALRCDPVELAPDGGAPRRRARARPARAASSSSRTGYTGEAGAELFVRADRARALADALVDAGARPVGLGARDTPASREGLPALRPGLPRGPDPARGGPGPFRRPRPPVRRPGGARETADRRASRSDSAGSSVADLRRHPSARHPRPLRREARSRPSTSGGMSPTLHHGIALAYLPVPLCHARDSGLARPAGPTRSRRGREAPVRAAARSRRREPTPVAPRRDRRPRTVRGEAPSRPRGGAGRRGGDRMGRSSFGAPLEA